MDTLTGSTAAERAAVLLDHCYLDGPGSAIHNRILRLTRQVWGEDPLAHERLLRVSPTCLRRVLRFWLRGLSPASFAWYRFPSGERECCYRHTRVPVPAFLVGALSLLGRGGYWRHSEPSAARTTRLFRIAGPYVSRYPAAKEALTWYRPLLKAFVAAAAAANSAAAAAAQTAAWPVPWGPSVWQQPAQAADPSASETTSVVAACSAPRAAAVAAACRAMVDELAAAAAFTQW
jgi:hypothetical protein